jgi:hypothetical protein
MIHNLYFRIKGEKLFQPVLTNYYYFLFLKSRYTSKNGIAANPKAISLLTVNDKVISKAKYNVTPAGIRPKITNLWLLSLNFSKSLYGY